MNIKRKVIFFIALVLCVMVQVILVMTHINKRIIYIKKNNNPKRATLKQGSPFLMH